MFDFDGESVTTEDVTAIDAERLDLAMRLCGVTTGELAARLGVTSQFVSMLRNGTRNASRDNNDLQERIAAALGVPVDWIQSKESAR